MRPSVWTLLPSTGGLEIGHEDLLAEGKVTAQVRSAHTGTACVYDDGCAIGIPLSGHETLHGVPGRELEEEVLRGVVELGRIVEPPQQRCASAQPCRPTGY